MSEGDYALRKLERILYVSENALLTNSKPLEQELALEIIKEIVDGHFLSPTNLLEMTRNRAELPPPGGGS
ncbi:hypothetical protein [Citrobacter gillenii]|uniref:hypothetical protein n=1 Tax=Citrobacter gillenii TaxID=67828 RepID=UPI000E3C7D63|nr:hypothetical protein [Citrobacter gillenii]RFU89021.1 hypothetical protein DZA29_24075 [Citrobacter gillenii]